jgi:spermidine/putrescine-binding protein
MDRKFAYLIVLFCLFALIGCTSQADKPTLTILTFDAYLPNQVVKNFSDSSGVVVTVEEFTHSLDALRKIEANPGRYDVIITSDFVVQTLIADEQLAALDLAKITNFDLIDPNFTSPSFDRGGEQPKYSVPYLWGTTGILYDPAKIDIPITQWADLWRPELAGHIVCLDDPREMLGMTLLTLGFDKNTQDMTQIQAAQEKFTQLAQGITRYEAAQPEADVVNGKAWVATLYNGNAAIALRQNPNLRYVLPAEGAGIWLDNLSVMKSSQNVPAAHAFINFILEPATSAIITAEYPYSNPNLATLDYLRRNNTALYDSYIASPASNPPADLVRNLIYFTPLANEITTNYETYWGQISK